jgi:imidazolonepropionase-like amidohydrolase
MKKLLFLLPALITFFYSIAQTDSGSFYLHKFAQNIGRESYTVAHTGNTLTYTVDFKFTDRGQAVPLKAQLVTTTAHDPVSLLIRGSTSRFSTINDSISIQNKKVTIRVDDSLYTETLKPLTFPVGGYSPGTVQMALLQYWKKHGEPRSIALLPTGSVSITRQGKEELTFMDKKLVLDRFVLSGLIWGNEIIWTDPNGKLICLITNDAEGDKLEMMETAYESLLPELISRGATYGMQLFAASMKMDPTKNKTLAIVGGNVVDVESGQTLRNQTIIIENGLIRETGAVASIKIPANATIIHAEGKTILPGLWDMHSHFEQAEWGPAYLAAGVTTVRDCGNEFGYINAIKTAIDSHNGVGPNILKAGIVDGPGDKGLGIVRATTEEEAIRVVNMYKNNGFVQIKIYSSVKPAIVKAICIEAHRLGLTVTGHIPMGMTIQQGVEAGMDQVNHMQYVFSVMKKNKDGSVNLDDSSSIAALNFLKEHKTVIDPTIGVFELAFRNVKDDITVMEPNFYTLPVPTQVLFKNTGMPEVQAKQYKPVYDAMKGLVKTLYDKGIPIVAGTDMGFPGYSVARELELYVEAGLTPLQAIQTATITPARVMKMDQQTGSIRVGKQADLVIIDGDPLSNIRDIRNVSMVIKQGQQYDPGTLHRMVGFAK